MRMRFALLLAAWLVTVVTHAADSTSPESTKKPRLLAQNKTKPNAGGEKPAAAAVSNEQEVVVLEFVGEHHAELAELLTNLKESRPKEFQKAVRELLRVRDRLAPMKKNNLRRYELELNVWKAESRIQLLAARLQMSDSKDLRDQLRTALNEQYDRKLTLLKFERDSFQERADKAAAQLKKFDQERSQSIDRQLEVLMKPVQAKASKSDKKPAAASAKTDAKPTAPAKANPKSDKQP